MQEEHKAKSVQVPQVPGMDFKVKVLFTKVRKKLCTLCTCTHTHVHACAHIYVCKLCIHVCLKKDKKIPDIFSL